jgi:hypothetical protein
MEYNCLHDMMRELSGENDFETRLFSGFQDSYFDRKMMFEPELCMELTYRRIEIGKKKSKKCKKCKME